jgi:hypothetical protein
MSCHPSKEDIQNWIEVKEDEPSMQETQGLRVNVKEWKNIYTYSDMHELFFMEFPCLLHKWVKRLATINSTAFLLETIVWDQTTLHRLKMLDNVWSQVIDFWFS